MPFNVALTGIRAATVDLEVTGNNIANASTVGFKKSRTEFGDLYANGFLSQGNNPVGDGVRVQNVRQQFAQGNISFTDNGLDMAINGEGFFVLEDSGDRRYSRAGQFGVNKDGYVVNSSGMFLQGFQANDAGVLSGVIGDLVIDNDNQPPSRTTGVTTQFNLDASEDVLVERGETIVSDGASVGVATASATYDNGYLPQDVTITQADGSTSTISIPANSSAGAIAALLNAVENVDASATTQATIPAATYTNGLGNMTVTVNGVPLTGYSNITDLGNAINASPSLVGVSAVLDASGDLVIIASRGEDLQFGFSSPDAGDTFQVQGSDAGPSLQTLNAGNSDVVVGGEVTLTLDTGMTIASVDGPTGGNTGLPVVDVFATTTGTPFVNNTFDPTDENTYNHATSTTIYDSLGNGHVMTMYFVKEDLVSGAPANLWSMHILIDDEDVGDPLAAGGSPTRATFGLVFNEDGTLNTNLSDDVLISNWVPLDSMGNPNGAEGPVNVVNGGVLPIPDPPTSSNFEIDIASMTQFGSDFSVDNLQQNGYTTGRLVGLDVGGDGSVFARFTNGESQLLGQVALANFNDVDGLTPVGDTTWVETFASGTPIIGAPGTASLGDIRASSLEESNVELSDELVGLIIAQRNYQANAKTIETANTVTQTIINLR